MSCDLSGLDGITDGTVSNDYTRGQGAKVPRCQGAKMPKCQRAKGRTVPACHCTMTSPIAPWHLGTLARWHLGTLAPWHVGPLAPSLAFSARNATIGSTRVALYAGSRQAVTDATTSATVVPANVHGSSGVTPNRSE